MKGRTSPLMPRAIYFGDDVYDAWLQGGDLPEIAAALFFPFRCLACVTGLVTPGDRVAGEVPGIHRRSKYEDTRC